MPEEQYCPPLVFPLEIPSGPFTSGGWEEPEQGPFVLEAKQYTQLRGPTPHNRPNIENEPENPKGDWAEEQFREYMTKQANPSWDFVGKHKFRKGLDGVYFGLTGASEEYLVVEVKYNPRTAYRSPQFGTILYEDEIRKRLAEAIGDVDAAEVIAKGYQRWQVRVWGDGTIKIKVLPPVPGR